MQLVSIMLAKEYEWLEVQEYPPGSNSGEIVSRLLRGEHVPDHQPWCNVFVRHIWHRAEDGLGLPHLYQPGGSTQELVDEATKLGKLTEKPAPGVGICFKGDAYPPSHYVHTEIAITAPDAQGNYITIGGNVHDGVHRRTHNISEAATFVRCE
jgi:hypothetical protein